MGLASGAGHCPGRSGNHRYWNAPFDHAGHSAHHWCFTAIGGCCPARGCFLDARLERLFPDASDGRALHRAGALVRQATHSGCRGPDPALSLYPHGQRRVPDRRIADAPVSAMGLDLLRRRPQPRSGRHDLAAVAVLWLLGHRLVCGNRHAFQWLDMDYAGLTTQEPARGPHGHHGLMNRHGKVDRRESRLGPAPVLSSLSCLDKLWNLNLTCAPARSMLKDVNPLKVGETTKVRVAPVQPSMITSQDRERLGSMGGRHGGAFFMHRGYARKTRYHGPRR